MGLCAMWHEFSRLRQQPPLPRSQPLVGAKTGKESEGLTQESGVFLGSSGSKELPASLYKPPSIGTKRKLNLQGAVFFFFFFFLYRGTFSH